MTDRLDIAMKIVEETCPQRRLKLENIKMFSEIIRCRKFHKGDIILVMSLLINFFIIQEYYWRSLTCSASKTWAQPLQRGLGKACISLNGLKRQNRFYPFRGLISEAKICGLQIRWFGFIPVFFKNADLFDQCQKMRGPDFFRAARIWLARSRV